MDDTELFVLHLDACAAEIAWCLIPHQPIPSDLRLLARAMAANAAQVFALRLDEHELASELLTAGAERAVFRGTVDASERAEYQAERIQSAWGELRNTAH